jgi:hypothetical protein
LKIKEILVVPQDKKRKIPIDYTSRDFNSIKEELLIYAKRYYPDTFQDYSEASFGSLMLDTVAYVGDVLSFYLDYQVNESFLDTATETENISKIAKQMGYKNKGVPVSVGTVSLYIIVPASVTGADLSYEPDLKYAPILKRGAIFSSAQGVPFTLIEDVNFNSDDTEVVVARMDETNTNPLSYAIKAYGQVMSGELFTENINVGQYEKYPRFSLKERNVVDIVSVTDSDGNTYYEVDYLSQDTIYVPVLNSEIDLTSQVESSEPIYNMKQISVPRRFITEIEDQKMYLQFGHGTEENIHSEVISDPLKIGINMHGRDYIQDVSFDPTNLISTDKLGIAPSNTTLTVVYRSNSARNVNISAKSLTSITNENFQFSNLAGLSQTKISSVIESIEFENENSIVGNTSADTVQEMKYKAYGLYNSQNRAVTQQDYMSLIYNMPGKFGSVERVKIVQDKNSFKRNLNAYVVSSDRFGKLTNSSLALKNNIKTWLSGYKMINDTIDILDAKIVNFAVNFDIIADTNANSYEVLESATFALQQYFGRSYMNIGEPITYGDIFRELKNVDGLLDVVSVEVVRQFGSAYSTTTFDMEKMTTVDGRMVLAPSDVIFELKFPERDIIGTIK